MVYDIPEDFDPHKDLKQDYSGLGREAYDWDFGTIELAIDIGWTPVSENPESPYTRRAR